nr:PRC-barrel domain-containing protein [Microvirga sp. VF16]
MGDISALIVDSSGKIQAVVVGVGGFLGIGEHDVAFPPDQIRFVNGPCAVATATSPKKYPRTTPGIGRTEDTPPRRWLLPHSAGLSPSDC